MKYITKENKEGKVIKLKNYKRRAKINKIKRKLLLITILLIILLIILCYTPILQIRKINCIGNKTISYEDIISASNIKLGDNMIRTSKSDAIDNIDNIPYIKSVEIEKDFPSTILIKITECEINSYIEINKKYIYLDDEGKVLEISDKKPEQNVPLLKSGKIKTYKVNEVIVFENSNQISSYKTLITHLKKSIFADNLTNIDISNTNNLNFTVNNEFTVKLGNSEELEYKIFNLATEVYNSPESTKKGTFDVSAANGKGYLKQEKEWWCLKKIFTNATFAIGMIMLIMAFLVTLQIKSVLYNYKKDPVSSMRPNELLGEIENLRKENAKLTEFNSALQSDIQSFKNEAATNSDYSKTLVDQLTRAEIIAGMTEVVGPGVIVTVKDSSYPDVKGDMNNYLIHDSDLLTIVNELRGAGAEALSINNERIISTTEIRCVGPTVSVNGTKITAPFVIKAIGDSVTLENSLMMRGGVYDSLTAWGLNIEINKVTDVVIPSYNGLINFEYAVPSTEGSEGN